MKRFILILLSLSMAISAMPVFAENTDINDCLHSSIAVMRGKTQCMVKGYCEDLEKAPVELGGKICIAAKDLERFGAEVDISDDEISVIYGAHSFFEDQKDGFYYRDNVPIWGASFIKKTDGAFFAELEGYAECMGLNYAEKDGAAVISSEFSKEEIPISEVSQKLSALSANKTMMHIYVSPGGNDSGTGTKSNPFKTVNKAKTRVSNYLSGQKGDIYVHIAKGEYKETLEFTVKDSPKGQYRVIYEGDDAKISVAEDIGGWENYSGNIYRTYIGEGKNVDVITENGELSTKARFPNEGYLYSTQGDKNSFSYAEDIPSISDISQTEAYLWGGGGNAWAADCIRVSAWEDKTVSLESSASYAMSANSRFFVQGALEFLDSPGEFAYCDGYLYYYPKNLPIAEQDIRLAKDSTPVKFSGSSKSNPVRNIEFLNLEFCETGRTTNAIVMTNCENIKISGCEFKNIGKNAVYMSDYAAANRIVNCSMTDIGASGVAMSNRSDGEETLSMNGRQNEVINCEIENFGVFDGGASGIGINTGYNTVKNCLIHGGRRMGISVGSSRPGTLIGKTVDGTYITRENARLATHSQNNIIMFCDIYDVMRDSQDGGAVYAWGADHDNVIAYNHIHDTCSPFSFAFGIYIDDGSDGFTIKNNIVDFMNSYKDGSVYSAIFTKGTDNKVYNNILANNGAQYAFMSETMVSEPCDNLEYERNIVYNSGDKMYLHKSYSEDRIKSAEKNVYYSKDENYGIDGIAAVEDIYEWQNYMGAKFDKYALIDTDPNFFDAEHGDYRLKYNSSALKNKIENIDISKIGLKNDFSFADENTAGKVYLKNFGDSSVFADIGESKSLSAVFCTDSGYKKEVQVEYTVADGSTARIENGKIIGMAKGRTVLSVSYNGSRTDYDVIVGDGIGELAVECAPVSEGKSVCANVYARAESGAVKNLPFNFKSSDEDIMTVSGDGLIYGKKAGSAELIVAFGEKKCEYTVNVLPKLKFSEDFEDSVNWTFSDSAIALDNSRVHSGKSSLGFGTIGTAEFVGDMSVFGNYAYEFWIYDDMQQGTALLTLSGTDKDGNNTEVLFGIKANAYSGKYYVANGTLSTGTERSLGWHRVIMDMTVDGKISVYIDGEQTAVKKSAHSLKNITRFRIYNSWYKKGSWKFHFDGFKIWESIDDVPRDKALLSAEFSDGSAAENAENITPSSGSMTLTFADAISDYGTISLLKKPKESESDADFLKSDIVFTRKDENSITLVPLGLEMNTRYRLCMSGIRCENYDAADGFFEFTTGEWEPDETKLIEDIYFSNGAKLPVNGVSKHFGNIFAKINGKTDNLSAVINDSRGNVIECTGRTQDGILEIDVPWDKICASESYRACIIGEKTETATFTTSADLRWQEADFYDSFEDGLINWSGKCLGFDKANAKSGGQSVRLDKNRIVPNFEIPENGVYEAWIYDANTSVLGCMIIALEGTDSSGNSKSIRFGQKNGYNKYIISNADSNLRQVMPRSEGWHRFVIDFTKKGHAKYYIDDVLVGERDEPMESVNSMWIGNPWNDGDYGMRLDDVRIWNTMDAGVMERFSVSDAVFDKAERRVGFSADNMTKSEKSAVIAVGVYDGDRLVDVKIGEKIRIDANDKAEISIDLPDTSETYKVFLWEDIGSMKPIKEASEI